jgi:hypothetical protein
LAMLAESFTGNNDESGHGAICTQS